LWDGPGGGGGVPLRSDEPPLGGPSTDRPVGGPVEQPQVFFGVFGIAFHPVSRLARGPNVLVLRTGPRRRGGRLHFLGRGNPLRSFLARRRKPGRFDTLFCFLFCFFLWERRVL